jgi:hypothetical protein
MDIDLLKTTLSTIFPTFTAYTITILSFLIKNQHKTKLGNKKVNSSFAFVSLFISVVLIFLTYFIFFRQYYYSDSMESYSLLLTAIQTFVAVHTGLILKAIFEENNQ